MSDVSGVDRTRPIYVEHCSHIGSPTKVRRYDDLPAALDGVRRTLMLGTTEPIRKAFADGKAYWWGSDSWRIVTAEDFLERMLHDCRMAGRMTLGQDVTDLQG